MTFFEAMRCLVRIPFFSQALPSQENRRHSVPAGPDYLSEPSSARQDFLQKKLDEGLSSKTVHERHGVLGVALKKAVRWAMVSRNVCDLVDPPVIVSREAVPLSVDQARVLVKHVRDHRLEVLLAMAIVTGMRRAELLALHWSDIDFERHRLLVLHWVDYIAGYGYVAGKPKTAAGKRWISFPAFLFGMLKQHQAGQLELRNAAKKWEGHDLVFPNLSGGYLHFVVYGCERQGDSGVVGA